MNPVRLDEIAPPEAYAPLRDAHRRAIVAHKRHRRLAVGDKVTLVFEDRETVRYQIQEMVWIERITDPDKIQDEIDVYNDLVPRENELSATLFVEITDAPQIRPELDRLIGIDEHVSLRLGRGEDEQAIRASFDAKQMEEDRISAVQYIRFPLSAAQAERLADPAVPARVAIDHPNYRREAELPAELRAALVASLRGKTASLLELPPGVTGDEVVDESERVRTLRRGRDGRHWIVEPRDPRADLLTADPETLDAILAAVRRAAAEIVREHGGCRVDFDVGGGGRGARWHLRARSD